MTKQQSVEALELLKPCSLQDLRAQNTKIVPAAKVLESAAAEVVRTSDSQNPRVRTIYRRNSKNMYLCTHLLRFLLCFFFLSLSLSTCIYCNVTVRAD